MSKAQNQDTNSTAKQMQGQTNAQTQSIMSGLGGLQGTSGAQSGDSFNSAFSGFKGQQGFGGYDPDTYRGLQGQTSNLSQTGGYDPNEVNSLNKILGDYTGTGGFDQGTMDSLNASANDLSQNGGIDSTAGSNIAQGYTSLAKTGGFTPGQEQAFIEQGTKGVQDTYNTLGEQLQRSKARTGGLGGGGDTAQLARQLSEEQARSTLNSNVSLNQMETQNKLAGLGGLNTSSVQQANVRNQAKEAALNTQAGLASNAAGNRTNLLGQQQAFQTSQAAGRQQGTAQQLGLEANAAAGRNQGNQGMAGLFKDASGNMSEQGRQILSALGINVQSQGQLNQVLASLAGNTKGPLSNTLDIGKFVFGMGGGGASPGMGG